MKIIMKVIESSVLDDYITKNTVPFAVCLAKGAAVSKRQKNFLEKYYDEVEDKRGWLSYYCNIINGWKCKDMGYESIEFADGKEEKIRAFSLETNKSVDDKYVVVHYFTPEEKIDSISLVKMIRLEVEDLKKKINN